jgi:hypothetical protein
MKKPVLLMLAAVVTLFSLLLFSPPANAEEINIVGFITNISIAGKDAKTASVTLKDKKTEKLVTITINDDLTLDKFKDHRIKDGDEIRCKYEVIDGKNVSKIFRKTAGC